MEKTVILIAGPTASGKSDLALRLAEQYKGEIVNADSQQVYADLNVLSARPDESTTAVKHHLYGYLNAFETGSVIDWVQRAADTIGTIETPIVVGGTGMYIDALMNGISMIPDVDPAIREQVRQMDLEEVESLVKDCKAVDSQRLRRALEVQLTTGKPLSYFQKQPKQKFLNATFQTFLVLPPREILYNKINARTVKMIEAGALDEVKRLQDIGATGGVMKAIGVDPIMQYLNGQIDEKTMSYKIQQDTRHYAKRQVTWFRHQLPADLILDNPDIIR